MQINNIKTGQEKNISSFNGSREIIRTLANPDALASTIVLESSVTGGRGYNAYKRGGMPELRERFTDDVVSAVFWMKGVDIFNSIGNAIGKHILKLPETEFDVGKDALRNPYKNLIEKLGKDMPDASTETIEKLGKKLAVFKFTKIIASTVLATGFIGFCLPKINQAITRKFMAQKKMSDNTFQSSKNSSTSLAKGNEFSFEKFNSKLDKRNENLSFKGQGSWMTTTAHCLENNKICKMLTCDVGVLTGRVKTARNADEGREYLFRDSSSSFFYFASTPLVYKLLQNVTKQSNLTCIDPVAAKTINKNLLEELKNSGQNSMKAEEFAKRTLGVLDEKSKEIIEKLPFKSNVITLSEFKKHIGENLFGKAENMSKLQPKLAGEGAVLTKQQAIDVLKNGSINSDKFMNTIFNEKFKENLTNPNKYIPMKQITNFRENIDKYTQGVINAAEKSNHGFVDEKLLNHINKKSFTMTAGFRLLAIAFSAFALGFVIPKLQYAMTAKRTGNNAAPGLREYNN